MYAHIPLFTTVFTLSNYFHAKEFLNFNFFPHSMYRIKFKAFSNVAAVHFLYSDNIGMPTW